MYTEEEHKQLFKRFFGETATLSPCEPYDDTIYMHNERYYFNWCNTNIWIGIDHTPKPYTQMMKFLYGKDICVIRDDVEYMYPNKKVFHVPSSFEEMSILCDLAGK